MSTHALLPFDRDEHYRRLDRRFDAMLDEGLVEEVRTLHARGDLNPHLPSLRTVGYRQFWAHLDGRLTFTEAVTAAKKATPEQKSWRGSGMNCCANTRSRSMQVPLRGRRR